MVKTAIYAAVFLTLAAPASAVEVDCEVLGLENALERDAFCTALQKLIPDQPTRSMGMLTELPDEPWAEIEMIQEAFRADPRKTLELIERIKNAGGLAQLESQ